MEVTRKEMKEWVEAAHGFSQYCHHGELFPARWLKTRRAIRALIEKYGPEEKPEKEKK